MLIHDMFAEDINRPINGVIKVDQDNTEVIEQEVREYVITKEEGPAHHKTFTVDVMIDEIVYGTGVGSSKKSSSSYVSSYRRPP